MEQFSEDLTFKGRLEMNGLLQLFEQNESLNTQFSWNFKIDAATQEKIKFKEMAQQIVNTASCLKEVGVKQNDVVAICSENRIEYLISTFAVFYSGAVLTCINNCYSKDEFIYTVNLSKPKFMIMSSGAFRKYNETLKNFNIVQKFIMFDKLSQSAGKIQLSVVQLSEKTLNHNKCQDVNVSSGTALILYTSGITGLAKGAKITHKNLIVMTLQSMPSSQNLTMLAATPWSSAYGLLLVLHGLFFGRTTVFLAKYDKNLYIKAIETNKIGMLITVPPIIVDLSKSIPERNLDFNSVAIIYSGGSALNLTIINLLQTRFPKLKCVIQGYGMTETTGAVTKETESEHRVGSVGKIVSGVIFKIVDVETRKILGNGETGEVCVKGPVLFDGYIGKDSKDDFDEDGFYKTGDIAYYDGDGYLYIVGRIKELIKYKATQVAPSELEALLLQHPAIKDAGVTGSPDLHAGELPTALIVKQPHINVTESEIVDYIDNKVSPWKRPRGGVIFVRGDTEKCER